MALFFDRNWLHASLRFWARLAWAGLVFWRYNGRLSRSTLSFRALLTFLFRFVFLFLESLEVWIELPQAKEAASARNRYKGSDISNERDVKGLLGPFPPTGQPPRFKASSRSSMETACPTFSKYARAAPLYVSPTNSSARTLRAPVDTGVFAPNSFSRHASPMESLASLGSAPREV